MLKFVLEDDRNMTDVIKTIEVMMQDEDTTSTLLMAAIKANELLVAVQNNLKIAKSQGNQRTEIVKRLLLKAEKTGATNSSTKIKCTVS